MATFFQKPKEGAKFTPPELWSFPPFFTIQPVSAVQEKQLKMWKDLIVNYCVCNSIYNLDVYSGFPYFRNDTIDRCLSRGEQDIVIKYLIEQGNGEWLDGTRTILRLIWKTPEALAAEVYAWGRESDVLGTVFTVYELHSGEDNQDSGE
jgi:ESCRT-II complex subunit VPS25